jgi:predicted RNase H-like HicB family nuclease
MSLYRFQVIIEQDEDGHYVADVPALRGCHTQGKTFEEAMTNIREVIEICVREMREDATTAQNGHPDKVAVENARLGIGEKTLDL